jgi:hypothetical protein
VVGIGARAAVLGAALALVWAALASAAVLPDGRRYELVSPVAKNGTEVITQTNKVHLTPDANAITYSALGGFGDLDGSAFDFQYMAKRTGQPGTNGWSSHGINPLARPVTLLHAEHNVSTFVDAFTPDLSAGIYKTWRPMVDAPNVREVSNLYRITGLTAVDPRTAQIMTDSVNAVPPSWAQFLNGFFIRTIRPFFVGASTDLTHVVFESVLNLTADAPPQDGFCQFAGFGCPTSLYENADGMVRLVGRIPDVGQTACDDVVGPRCVTAPTSEAGVSASTEWYPERMVSQDGRRIYFAAPGGIYLREDGVRTEELATSGTLWTASRDGSRAFFTTDQSLIPGDAGSSDVYMYDRDADPGSRFTLVSAPTFAAPPGGASAVIDASADGRSLYFVYSGQLVPEATNAIAGIYRWQEGGQLRFIGKLVDSFEAGINGPRTIWTGISQARTSRVTPDGRHLLFMTTRDRGFRGIGGFAGYEHNNHRELYLYSADTGRLVCASCNPTGRPATADALIDVRENEATSQSTTDSSQALTDDGRRVFFNTAEALVPEDFNGRPDPYEYDAQTGRVHLLSSGQSTAPSYFVEASANGNDVFIVTRERLVGWDVDNLYDLYDARVGGGFPEPPPALPACTGDACLPAAATSPAAESNGSNAHEGPGDVKARLRKHRKCSRKRVLRKVRGRRKCVKRRGHRRAKRALALSGG